jgi:hypothetical protein
MRLASILICLMLTGMGFAQNPAERLEKGIYEQDTAGDLIAAVAIYRAMLKDGKGDDATLAEAAYRLGQCQLLSGKTAEAKASFSQLISRFPQQQLQVGKILDHLQQPDLSASAAVPHPLFRDREEPNGEGPSPLQRKLNQIVIPKLTFEEASIETVVAYLRQRSKELDADGGEGVNIVLRLPDGEAPALTLDFDNIPLGEVIRYACQATNLRYRVEEYAVVLASHDALLESLETRFYPTSGSFLQAVAAAGGEAEGDAAIIAFFESMGVQFPEGSKLKNIAGVNRLVVTQAPSEFRKIEQIMRELITQPIQVRISAELQVVDDPRLAALPSGAIDRQLLDQIPAEKRHRYSQLSAVTLNGSTCQTVYEGDGLTLELETTPMVDSDGFTIQVEFNWRCKFTVENPAKIDMLTIETALVMWDGEGIALRLPAGQTQGKTCVLLLEAQLLNPAGQPIRDAN